MKKAFTLIELMLVVVIIGVLASLVVPRLAGRAERARRIAASADVKAHIPSALDLYEMDMGEYPEGLSGLADNVSASPGWAGPYLNKVPKDPWGREYIYKYPGEHGTDYDLFSSGKDGISGNEDDVASWD